MAKDNRVQENRVRRVANRRGFIVKRSRRRDPQAIDYGRYWLFPQDGSREEQLSFDGLDDVEEWLRNYKRE